MTNEEPNWKELLDAVVEEVLEHSRRETERINHGLPKYFKVPERLKISTELQEFFEANEVNFYREKIDGRFRNAVSFIPSNDEVLSRLHEIPELTRVMIFVDGENGFTATDAHIHLLSQIPTIRILDLAIKKNAFTKNAFESLSRLPTLHTLILADLENISDLMGGVSMLRKLRYLDVSNMSLDEGSLESIGKLKMLQDLRVASSLEEVTRGYDSLGNLQDLKGFYISVSGLSDENSSFLTQLKSLEYIDCEHSNVADETMKRLATLLSLTKVAIAFCPLVTREGIRELTRSKSIEALTFDFERIDSKVLSDLSKMKNLKQLTLIGGKLKKSQARMLKESHPALTLYEL